MARALSRVRFRRRGRRCRPVVDDLPHQQARSHHDGAVRQVEHRPTVRTQIEKQKVHHLAVQYPVQQVAAGAAGDQRHGVAGARRLLAAPQQHQHHHQRHTAAGDQGIAKGGRRVLEQPERHPRVLGMDDAKQAGDNAVAVVVREGVNEALAPLVGDKHRQAHDQVAQLQPAPHEAISPPPCPSLPGRGHSGRTLPAKPPPDPHPGCSSSSVRISPRPPAAPRPRAPLPPRSPLAKR